MSIPAVEQLRLTDRRVRILSGGAAGWIGTCRGRSRKFEDLMVVDLLYDEAHSLDRSSVRIYAPRSGLEIAE